MTAIELYCIFSFIFVLGGLIQGNEVFTLSGILSLIISPIWFPYVTGKALVFIMNK